MYPVYALCRPKTKIHRGGPRRTAEKRAGFRVQEWRLAAFPNPEPRTPSPYFFVRTINVTGPSLTTRTIMAAPKTPVRIVRPCLPASVSATRS